MMTSGVGEDGWREGDGRQKSSQNHECEMTNENHKSNFSIILYYYFNNHEISLFFASRFFFCWPVGVGAVEPCRGAVSRKFLKFGCGKSSTPTFVFYSVGAQGLMRCQQLSEIGLCKMIPTRLE